MVEKKTHAKDETKEKDTQTAAIFTTSKLFSDISFQAHRKRKKQLSSMTVQCSLGKLVCDSGIGNGVAG